MRPLFIAALLLASAASAKGQAFMTSDAPVLLAQAETPDTGATSDDQDDEEEEDEGTEGPAAPAPGPTTETGAAETGTAPTTQNVNPEPSTGATTSNAKAQELVSGAPLYNPNVAVHIVEKKQFSDKGKHELALYPAVAQVNGKFTEHYGTALSYTYHLHENFAFQITPQYNWINSESGFNQELINKVREEAQAATSLLLNWAVMGGVEVTPLYGKFAWYADNLAHYSVVLDGAAGYGGTRHQLKPNNSAGPATYGETGNRFVGSLGGGFRVLLGNRFAIRLEVRDIVYTARVDEVNGCTAGDLGAMDAALRGGRDVTTAQVSTGCRVDTFAGKTDSGESRSSDVPLALSLVREPTSDVLNLVSFYGGVSFIF